MASVLPLDELTRVLTRSAGEELLQGVLRRGAPVAVLFVDIDHFKSINDAFGHEVGDHALQFVAERLREVVGQHGHVARYGGDEFFVILPEADESTGRAIGEQLLEDLGKRVVSPAYPLHLRLSIGMALGPQDGTTPALLLRTADRRHYFAKHAGGHCLVATDRRATGELVAVPRRPIGQRQQLASLYTHLEELLHHSSGVIRVQAPPFGGAENFLRIAQDISRLQGYLVIPVQATPARHLRYLGAVGHAVAHTLAHNGEQVPSLETPTQLLGALRHLLSTVQPAKGLLLTIANASWLDEASIEVVQQLLRLPKGFEHVGVVYAAVGSAQTRFRAPMYASITLPPLDRHEVKAWIRHALRWEPPEAMARWVWEQTEGLPEKVHQTLTALVHQGYLQPLPEGWRWQTPTDWEPLAPVAADPAQIGVPTDLPLLFGRNRDLWVLQEAVRKSPLVTVSGAGGVGKSRLLQQLALESHEHFPDGVRYVALEGVSGDRLATALARGLRIPLQMRSEVFPQIAQHLQSRRMLLVLDGVTAAPEATKLLSRLASAAPQNRWVVGALWQLHLPTEHVIRLGGLETREEEGASPAAHLFFHIARRSGGGQHCSESRQREEIEAICRWAEGSPMAVRILASWCNTLTPAQILKSLSHVKTRTNPLEAALDAFWEALSPDERRRLALLALFEGAFPLAAAREVADASLFFLDALAAKTYLSRRSGGRFYLHPLLQQYARARLQAFPAEVAQAERQHAFWYLKRLPETGGAHTEADRWGFVASEDDLPDVIKAWQWALRHREAALLAEAAPWVFPSLGEQNRFTETSALVDESVASLRRWLPRERTHDYFLLRAYLEVMRAEFHYHLGDYQEALHRLQRVYRRQFPLLPPLHQAHVTAVLGRVYSAVGDYAAAVSFMEHAYQVYQQENVRPLLLTLLNATGIAAYGQGDLTAAEHFFGKALEISREQEKPRAVAALLNNLGNIAWQRGRHQQAERLLREALRLLQKEDAPSLKASVLDSVARVESTQGAYQRALNHLNEAITLSQRISAWPNALVAMSTAAYVWAEIGHIEEAADLLATITRCQELPHYDYAQVQEVMRRLPEGEPLTTTDVASLAQYVLNQNRLWGMELSHAAPNSSSGGSS